MLPLPLPTFIWAPSQTSEAKLATLAPEIQAAAAELKRLGYTLRQASAPPRTRGVIELKHSGSSPTLVVVFQPAQVKLHLNVPLSDALYGQSETLKKQLATTFPGLEQFYLGASDGKNIANLSIASTVATPPKSWYSETLTTLQRAAEQLVGKPFPELDMLALDDTFKANIQEHLRVLAANRFTVSQLEKKDSSALTPPYFVQLLARDTHRGESTVAFFFQEKATLYSTSTEIVLTQPHELAQRELRTPLQELLPEAKISFFGSLEKPGTSTLKLAYPISAQGRLSLLQQLESLHTARLLAQKTPVIYSTKEQELLSKLSSNAFQRSVIGQVKRGGWRIDNAYAFTQEKDPLGVYLAVSRSEAPKPNAALPPLSLKLHHSKVELNAIGFVPAKSTSERLAFQEQLQKTYPAFRVTALSSALTPGYDRIVFVLPEPMTALDVPHKLLATLQRLQEAVEQITH